MSESESGKPKADGAAGPLRSASARARAGIDQAKRASREVIAATREKGEAVIEETREKGYRAAAETNRLFQEHPIAAVAAAAAAGAVLGIFLPRLALTGKASQLASRAVKAAAKAQAPRKLLSGLQANGRRVRRENDEPADSAPAEETGVAPEAPSPQA